jgi:hypothetical protein
MAEFREADLVDRISIDLSLEQEQRLSHWISKKKEAISYDREEFLERQKKYLFDFDDFVSFTRKGPWDGSSNYHMPLTSIVTKSYHARLYNIFTQKDTTNFLPRESMDEGKVDIIKALRNWYLWDYINEYKGIKGVANELFYDVCTVGFGIVMKSWDLKQRKVISLEKNQLDELNKEAEALAPEIEEAKKKERKVSVKPYKEVQKILTVFEGTKLLSVPFENAYFPNEIPETSDLDHPEMVLVVTKMSMSDLVLRAEQGQWDRDKVELIRGESIPGVSSETREKNVKELRDRLTGYDTQNTFFNADERDIEYVFCSYDIDDDGINEEIVVTRSPKGVILKVTHLDRVSPGGRRPLFKFDCFTKPRQAYSRGIPEFVHPLQEEMDMNHNLRLDYLQLQTCPFGVYRGGSSLDNQPIRIAPGKFIPVDEITDLRPITFNSNAGLFAGEEDRLWRYAEWLTSVSPLSQGAVGPVVGPTRSTSGVVTLLQQMDKQLRPIVEHNAVQWKKMEQAILEDLDYRVSPAMKMRVLGASVQDPVNEEEKRSIAELNQSLLVTESFDLAIDVASVISSDEVRRNEASILLQTLNNPSLLQQAGIVGPKALLKLAQEFLKSYGKRPDQYLDAPEFIDKALTLYQEIQVCAQGEIPPMSMQDDHEGKAKDLEAFMESEEFMEASAKQIYAPDAGSWFTKTIEKHRALADALAPQGGPNPTGEQGASMDALMSGQAPQQGGESVGRTTSRDLAGGESAPNVSPEGLGSGGAGGGVPS